MKLTSRQRQVVRLISAKGRRLTPHHQVMIPHKHETG
jgi:hypothetical protein